MFESVEINYLAVLLAAVLSMAAGAFWYSTPVFGKQWLAAVGKKREEIGSPAVGYILTSLGSLLTAYVLAHIVSLIDASTVLEGVTTGFWVWLGFVVPTMLANHVFEGKPRALYFINAGYPLLAFVLMGGLLAVWR